MNNKVVVIVGATGGIGSAVAQKLANSGANLVLAARDNNRLDALATQLSTTEIITVPTNITNSQEVEI
ncbi:MAG: SDR family NAD(P)-dependent oxidoreductase, partial [Trichodesmium sp. St15_bin1_1]|nr:SDR family NAD(P)-dependent oxidoreductase [Trichodesmium sp. St15_bin1_1]